MKGNTIRGTIRPPSAVQLPSDLKIETVDGEALKASLQQDYSSLDWEQVTFLAATVIAGVYLNEVGH